MGETQSTETQHEHSSKSNDDVYLSPSQKAFSTSFKLDKKDFPLMNIKMGEDEIKYADTRPHMIDSMDGKMHWEMFWMGELENLDQEAFLSKVQPELEKYGGCPSGKMREAGCMISMIALPFLMSEENSLKMGHDMFIDFGTDKVVEKKKEDPHKHSQPKEIQKTPSQKAFSVSLKLEKKEHFPLMSFKIGENEYKYADTRPHSILPTIGEELHWEMFWTGELENLDTKLFSEKVQSVVEKYGGRITSKIREAGCMMSMIAIAFSMPEDKTIEMGKDMFEGFGQEPPPTNTEEKN